MVWHSSEGALGLPRSIRAGSPELRDGFVGVLHPEGGQGIRSTQINGYEFMKNNIRHGEKTSRGK